MKNVDKTNELEKSTNNTPAHSHDGCGNGEHQHKKHNHGLMMILCCLAMVLALIVLPRFGRPFSFLAVLACPLMHIFMMKGMFSKEKN